MTQITIDQAIQIAIQHHQAGRLIEAEDIYRQVLRDQPNHPDAAHLLGVIAHQTGRLDLGIQLMRQAVAMNPTPAHYHHNLANALWEKKLTAEAIAAYRKAIELKPDYYEAHYNLGVALREQGTLNEAITSFRNSISANPGFAEAWNDLGSALREKGLHEEAASALQEAIRLDPASHKAHNNLGNVLREQGRIAEAAGAFRNALALRPDIPEIHNNLGNTLRDQGLLDEAIAAFTDAIRLRPDFAEAHHHRAMVHLLKGDFPQGLPEYEWRTRCRGVTPPRGELLRPLCDAATLSGRTILLYNDSGFGDAIQFVRYVPMVANLGAKVILECHLQMFRLLQNFPGVHELIPAKYPLPKIDLQYPLMSLPFAFNTTLETIPAAVPYLHADPELARKWSTRLANQPGAKVGIAWAGNSAQRNDRHRSLTLSQLAPLSQTAGITFDSLQKGPPAEQAAHPPRGMNLIDYSKELTDFAETAALIANLDLIITVDTAVAHLAGAMGKPVWVMIYFAADWRYLLDRTDNPWYPTMRLFRQKTFGDWTDPVENVAHELKDWRAQQTAH